MFSPEGDAPASSRHLAPDPDVLVTSSTKLLSWPKHSADAAPRVERMPLSVALETFHDSDALVFQYTYDDGPSDGPRRLSKEYLERDDADLLVGIFPIDVDCPKEIKVDGLAPDAWLAVEKKKVDVLLDEHPGGIYYPTRGGYRVLYRLAPRAIRNTDDAADHVAEQKARYAYIKEAFDITADPAMAAWSQLCKLPRVPNAKVRGGLIEGDVRNVGELTLELTDEDVAPFREKKARARKLQTPTEPWWDRFLLRLRNRRADALLEKFAKAAQGPDEWLARGQAAGVIFRDLAGGMFAAACPKKTHTGSETKTVYFHGGGFKCYGSECENISGKDFRRFIESKEAQFSALEEVPAKVSDAVSASMFAPVVLSVPTGAGKSLGLRTRIAGLGKASRKLAVLVPTHDLARQYEGELRKVSDIRFAHHAAITQTTNEREACSRPDDAAAYASLGLSPRKLLCPTCPKKDSCHAKEEPKGDVPIGPVQYAARFAGDGLRPVFDEMFPMTEVVKLSSHDLADAARAINGIADKESSALLAPYLDVLRGYEPKSFVEALRHANEQYDSGGTVDGRIRLPRWVPRADRRVDPALPPAELARACAGVAPVTPGLARGGQPTAKTLQALAALAKVRKSASGDMVTEKTLENGTLELRVLTSSALAFKKHGGLILSATPLVEALRALRPDLRVEALAIADGSHRTLVETGEMHTGALKEDRERLRNLVDQALGRARAAGCTKVFLCVAKTVVDVVRAHAEKVKGRLVVDVAHYGAVIGLDAWMTFDGFVTIGENFINKDENEGEAELLGIDASAHWVRRVEADLAQAHGRARDPVRPEPAHHWHFGKSWPTGWTTANTNVEEAKPGPKARVVTASQDVLRDLVKQVGGQSEAARRLNVPRPRLRSYLDGRAVAPEGLVNDLRKLAEQGADQLAV